MGPCSGIKILHELQFRFPEGGGGEVLHYKSDGVLVGMFREHP